jgi:glycerophosphoryl diester phosphodiesterase
MRAILGLLLLLTLPTPALGADNPWLERRVLHMAHQGGELEAPSNTFFAYERALANGADMLEMDVNITADRQLVVFHDTTVDGRTNGTGRVNELTVAQLKTLDAADGWPEYRGIATGERRAPKGFTREDFQIPTLREVLERYPKVLMNIEIKGPAPDTTDAPSFAEQLIAGNPGIYDAAEVLAALLAEYDRVGDTVVVSFSESATTRFKLAAPAIHTAAGLLGTAAFFASSAGPAPGAPSPQHHALQPPTYFEGIEVPTRDFVDAAHANGLAVHVWLAGKEEENAATYGKLIDAGVDGIMTDTPTRLEAALAERKVRYKAPRKPKKPRRGERRR